MRLRVALIFNLRFLLPLHPNMVPFYKKIVPWKDYCNRTTGKSADQALQFRIHQWFEFEEFLNNGKPYRNFVQIILKEYSIFYNYCIYNFFVLPTIFSIIAFEYKEVRSSRIPPVRRGVTSMRA